MIDEDKEKAAPAAVEGAAPARRGKRWVLLVAALLVLGGGGAGAFWWIQRSGHANLPAGAQVPSHAGVLALSQFTVNLADQEVSRFLRATVHLVLDDREEAEAIAEDELRLTRIRSAVLELLTVQTADRIVTPEGKAALKQAIAERTSDMLKPIKVTDVLFSDFVVQF